MSTGGVIVVIAIIAALIVFISGLCKIAAKGNIYCPSCKSEDNKIAARRVNRITRVCNACGHKW